MRTTKKDVLYAFDNFCKVYNLKTSATVVKNDPAFNGQYYSNEFIKLDYASCYGGYRLDIVEVGTGERFFDSASRRSTTEMISYLRGLLAAKNKYLFEGGFVNK